MLPHIRFPAMTTTEVATRVSPTKILDQSQTLMLFTYLATKSAAGGKDAPPPKGLAFPHLPRKGRCVCVFVCRYLALLAGVNVLVCSKAGDWFVFDKNLKHSSLTLSDDGKTITSTTNTYQSVFGTAELSSGVHEFEIVLDNVGTNQLSCCVGFVASSAKHLFTSSMVVGYPGHLPGWSFGCCGARKFHSKNEKYGNKCRSGQTVKLRLDLDASTLEFFVDGAVCFSCCCLCSFVALAVARSGVQRRQRPRGMLFSFVFRLLMVFAASLRVAVRPGHRSPSVPQVMCD